MMKMFFKSLKFLVLLASFFPMLASCTPEPKVAMVLRPDEPMAAGYERTSEDAVFTSEKVTLKARQVKRGSPEVEGYLGELAEKGYVLIRLEIENRSDVKVIFNPVYAALMNETFYYEKPLDFTDLYDIKGGMEGLGALKGKFYDLSETVAPGRKVSKLLIFKPLEKDMVKAGLSIKDLYIGTDYIKVYFPFVLKEA